MNKVNKVETKKDEGSENNKEASKIKIDNKVSCEIKEEGEEDGPQLSFLIISISEPRLKQCLDECARIATPKGHVFVLPNPVNGNLLPSLNELAELGIYKPVSWFPNMTRGQLACFQSHRNAWSYVVAHNTSMIILEDDVIFQPLVTSCQKLSEIIRTHVPNDWQFCFLGRNPRMAQVCKRLSAYIVVPGKTWGLFAYMVTPACAKILLQYSMYDISCEVDYYVSAMIQQRKLDKVYSFDHPAILVTVREGLKSDTKCIL
jgi:GR25 family glycosyltransferase involved in LPS biosynthesis